MEPNSFAGKESHQPTLNITSSAQILTFDTYIYKFYKRERTLVMYVIRLIYSLPTSFVFKL